MKHTFLFLLVLTSFAISACTIRSQAYLRNFTNQSAIIDVRILDKKQMPQLPDAISVAMEVLPIESGMYEKLDDIQTVVVKDSLRFAFELKPKSTADLSDLVGEIWNGSWKNNVRVIVLTETHIDTIINGRGRPNRTKFDLYEKGVADPIYYYDVK